MAINVNDGPTRAACTDVMKSVVRQRRYRLKKKYFNGVPANEIRTTSPVANMIDEQWRELVAKWNDPKNTQISETYKGNRSNVKYHQTTGSRSYVAHLHVYRQKRKEVEPTLEDDDELDAVDAFRTCHTSSKTGLTEQAQQAVSQMETLKAAPVPNGEEPISSAQIVAKVLTEDSSMSNTFLKNAGLQSRCSSRSVSSTERELREQLETERQAKAALQEQVDALKMKSEIADENLAKTQKKLDETTKIVEENNMLLRRLLTLNGNLP